MNTMINMIVVVEKELELERQGMRRTRRFIGDARHVSDAQWYQTSIKPVAETRHSLVEASQAAGNQARREAAPSLLARIFHPSHIHQEASCDEC